VRDELRKEFPQLGAEAAVVAYRQATPIADDPAGLQALVSGIQGSEGTTTVVDPLRAPAEAGLVAPDGRTALVPVGLRAAEDADLPETVADADTEIEAEATPVGGGAEGETTEEDG
jgi:hypothetical protein